MAGETESVSDLPWEDGLLERKVESDLKDLLKTIVAFANSVRPGHTALILIGEKDDGSAQGVKSPDNIQKTVREYCNKVYPPILWRTAVYEKAGKHCVRVEIEYDGDTPHFGDAAWVRRGSSTEKASDEVFQKLIDLRLSKVEELAQWLGKEISVQGDTGALLDKRLGVQYEVHPRLAMESKTGVLKIVNKFWASFEIGEARKSEPLEKLILTWDDINSRLKILVRP